MDSTRLGSVVADKVRTGTTGGMREGRKGRVTRLELGKAPTRTARSHPSSTRSTNGALFKLEEAFAKQKRPLAARMFISAGSLEAVQFRGPIEQFEKQIGARGYKGLELQTYTVEGTDHFTVKPESYFRGLKWVWQGRQ